MNSYMSDPLLEYMLETERAVNRLPSHAAFAFALACSERQWPVYVRASKGRKWFRADGSALRSGLDAAWTHFIHHAEFPRDLPAKCESEFPDRDDIVDGPSAFANTIANSIQGVLSDMGLNRPAGAHFAADHSIDLLDGLRDEFEDQPTVDAICRLLDEETRRQQIDLEELARSSSPATLDLVRRRSVGVSLFGQQWFPE